MIEKSKIPPIFKKLNCPINYQNLKTVRFALTIRIDLVQW